MSSLLVANSDKVVVMNIDSLEMQSDVIRTVTNDPTDSDSNDETMVSVCFKDFEDTQLLSSATSITFRDLETSNPSCIVELKEKIFEFVGKYEYGLGHKLYFNSDCNYDYVGDSAKHLMLRLKKIPLFR